MIKSRDFLNAFEANVKDYSKQIMMAIIPSNEQSWRYAINSPVTDIINENDNGLCTIFMSNAFSNTEEVLSGKELIDKFASLYKKNQSNSGVAFGIYGTDKELMNNQIVYAYSYIDKIEIIERDDHISIYIYISQLN